MRQNHPEAVNTCGFTTLSYVNLFAEEFLYSFEHGILGWIYVMLVLVYRCIE